ncbi:MAG: BON domain-containing protein [Planctomycetia bacterium]|nr:BON domain-containing protein [Planctomycetia bacterium]
MDTVLKNRVTNALGKNPYLMGSSLEFKTERGQIILEGSVPSFFQKQMAQETLRFIDGITEIKNELKVRNSFPVSGFAVLNSD